jgi:peptide/nickel transport system permease protein
MARLLRYLVSGSAIVGLNFLLPRLLPGDPVVHLIGAEDYYRYPELAARLRARHGLDEPLPVQFGLYLRNLLEGDLGYSFRYRRPVEQVVGPRLKWTLVLVVPGVALGGLGALVLGGLAGWYRGRSWERCLTLGMMVCKSLPVYGVAMLALLVLAYRLELFPLGGVGSGRGGLEVLWHAALPLLVLALFNAAQYYLILRNTVARTRLEPFIAAARARGLDEARVLLRHGLRPALPPFLTLVGLGMGFSVAGALLVEIVFSWPGMGTLILSAVESRDYALLQGCFLLLALAVLAVNWATDAAYGWCDPRVRYSS